MYGDPESLMFVRSAGDVVVIDATLDEDGLPVTETLYALCLLWLMALKLTLRFNAVKR